METVAWSEPSGHLGNEDEHLEDLNFYMVSLIDNGLSSEEGLSLLDKTDDSCSKLEKSFFYPQVCLAPSKIESLESN